VESEGFPGPGPRNPFGIPEGIGFVENQAALVLT
jgi:hypothetical protein